MTNFYITGSFEKVRTLFRERFPEREPPTTMTIWRNVKKYENIYRVQEALEHNPRGISCRRNGLNLSSASFNRIMRLDLKWPILQMVFKVSYSNFT